MRLRHKIEKASAAKQRKQRKLAKKVRSLSLLMTSLRIPELRRCTESRMADEAEERPGHSQPVSTQRQDIGRD